MENHDWSTIVRNDSAPYLNKTLLPRSAHASQYYNPPGNHPSLPNYLWLEAGTNFGILDDSAPADHMQSTHAHLVMQLQAAKISWRTYVQGIDGATCPLTDSYPYATRHNAMIYFSDVTNGGSIHSTECITHERPYGELTRDLGAGKAARYNVIIPDLCHDMHDDCGPTNNAVRQGDDFLAGIVPRILASHQYRSGGAIFITWDEGEGDDGPIGLIALSPWTRAGYISSVHYSHSSTLRTIQEIFRVRPFLQWAAQAHDLSALFHH